MQMLRQTLAAAALATIAATAGAQTRARVPAQYLPPVGLCRVWFDGVAPERQPAPTSCALARTQLRSNARLIYGTSDGEYAKGNQEYEKGGAVQTGAICQDLDRDGVCDYRQRDERYGKNEGGGVYSRTGDYDRERAERVARERRELEARRRELERREREMNERRDIERRRHELEKQQRELEKQRRKAEHEREKAARKSTKSNKGHDGHDDDDDDHDDDHRGKGWGRGGKH